MKTFKIGFPLESEYFTTVRLTTGGLCALADFDVDSTEDFKVCVTESLLILKRNGFLNAELSFTIGEMLVCEIVGANQTGEKQDGFEDEISYALLNALLGKVEFSKDENGRVTAISFGA
jgi:hypothetical protein